MPALARAEDVPVSNPRHVVCFVKPTSTVLWAVPVAILPAVVLERVREGVVRGGNIAPVWYLL